MEKGWLPTLWVNVISGKREFVMGASFVSTTFGVASLGIGHSGAKVKAFQISGASLRIKALT